MTKLLKSMGIRLRTARLERQLSQSALGSLIGKSKQQVSAWETGRSDMTLTTLVTVARVLEVNAGWLVNRSADKKG